MKVKKQGDRERPEQVAGDHLAGKAGPGTVRLQAGGKAEA
jgi:hypothetical protein